VAEAGGQAQLVRALDCGDVFFAAAFLAGFFAAAFLAAIFLPVLAALGLADADFPFLAAEAVRALDWEEVFGHEHLAIRSPQITRA
jgi:hypothetical protein